MKSQILFSGKNKIIKISPICRLLKSPESSGKRKVALLYVCKADLRVKYKTAAGFAFKTQYFFTSWGPTNNSSDLIIEQYTNRSADDPKLDRVKQLLIPQYIKPGRWGTHWSKPVKGFQR